MKTLTLLCLLCAPLCGQFSYGIIAGAPFENLTNGLSAGSLTAIDKSGHYTVGPSFQIALPLGFRIEADALYRPLGVSEGGTVFSSSQWRFPVLAQYRLSIPVVKPFVEAGYSYDHVTLTPAANLFSVTSHHGFVVGAGIDLKIPFVRISPEIRFTHDVGSVDVLNSNQAEFLLGIRF